MFLGAFVTLTVPAVPFLARHRVQLQGRLNENKNLWKIVGFVQTQGRGKRNGRNREVF
jgi:hypothetical protein